MVNGLSYGGYTDPTYQRYGVNQNSGYATYPAINTSPYANNVDQYQSVSFQSKKKDASNDGKFSLGQWLKNAGKGALKFVTGMLSNPKTYLAAGIMIALSFTPLAPVVTLVAGAMTLYGIVHGGVKMVTSIAKTADLAMEGRGDEAERVGQDFGAAALEFGVSVAGAKAMKKGILKNKLKESGFADDIASATSKKGNVDFKAVTKKVNTKAQSVAKELKLDKVDDLLKLADDTKLTVEQQNVVKAYKEINSYKGIKGDVRATWETTKKGWQGTSKVAVDKYNEWHNKHNASSETVKSEPNVTMTTNADGSKSIKIIKDGKEININRIVEYKDGKWTVTDKNLKTGDITIKNYNNKNLINAKAEKSKAFSDYHKLKDDPNYNANDLKNNALNADKKLTQAENYEKTILEKRNKMIEDAKKLELENKRIAEENSKKATEQSQPQAPKGEEQVQQANTQTVNATPQTANNETAATTDGTRIIDAIRENLKDAKVKAENALETTTNKVKESWKNRKNIADKNWPKAKEAISKTWSPSMTIGGRASVADAGSQQELTPEQLAQLQEMAQFYNPYTDPNQILNVPPNYM